MTFTPAELLLVAIIALLLLALALSRRPTQRAAVTKHVAKTGADVGSTGPFLTIGYATRQLAGGDALEVHDGTYPENLTHVPAGTAGAYTRIYAAPGETVRLQPTAQSPGGAVCWLDGAYHHIEIDGLTLDGSLTKQIGVWLSTNNGHDVHAIRIRRCRIIAGETGSGGAIDLGSHNPINATGGHEVIDCTISGGGKPGLCGYQCASYGVYVKVPNCRIEGNDISDVSGAGVHVYSQGASPDSTTIRRNRIHDITRTGSIDQVWGVLIARGNGCEISDKLFYRIQVSGAHLNPGNGAIALGGTDTKAWHNTIDDCWLPGIVTANATRAVVQNNIVARSMGPAWIDGGGGTVQTNNLFSGDPKFVNAGAGDFHLQAGSPAIDAGVDVGVATDFYGTPRQGACDLGACEYIAAPAPTPTPTPTPPPTATPPPTPGPTPTPLEWQVTGTVLVDLTLTPAGTRR